MPEAWRIEDMLEDHTHINQPHIDSESVVGLPARI